MRLFSEISESKVDEIEISREDFDRYLDSMKRKLPKDVLSVLQYLRDNDIYSNITVRQIRDSSKPQLKFLARAIGISDQGIVDLQASLKKLDSNINLLPMFMSDDDRTNLERGDKTIEDITLDLTSEKGRASCAKRYASLVVAIARKYQGKSGLDWNSLISAGQLGLTAAMNDYKQPNERIDIDNSIDKSLKGEAKRAKGQTFKQYAGWRIRNQILNDINALSRTVRITQHEYEKNKANGNTQGNFNTKSIDVTTDDEGRSMLDRMPELSNSMGTLDRDHDKMFAKLYKCIDSKFSTRDASIFYQYMGLRGYKQKTGLELAKENGLTSPRISYIVGGILKYLRSEPKLTEYLDALRDLYSESLLYNNYNKSQKAIMEVLISDDIYIMLNELTRWNSKEVFNNAIGESLTYFNSVEKDFLMECLHEESNYIDDSYNRETKKVYTDFLEHIYPTENIHRFSDVEIINRMVELNELFHRHNIDE